MTMTVPTPTAVLSSLRCRRTAILGELGRVQAQLVVLEERKIKIQQALDINQRHIDNVEKTMAAKNTQEFLAAIG